jgi:alanine-glyoxylate transaminase/serine-glyoxylate transaminase/serine-pyruvate transaminase
MTRNCKLFIPGPCDLDDDVMQAMSSPVQRSYGSTWLPTFDETIALLKQIFCTRNDIFMVPGPGSAALDMALGSCLAAGEKVIVAHNGFFGERMATIATSYGLNVVAVTAPSGLPLEPEQLRRALNENPDAALVALVHHETTTTVLNPLQELAAVTRAAGRVLLVDAVSSLGGAELPVDDWGIDLCVASSNKCLETPPGLALISISERAWDLVDRHAHTHHGWYLDLRTWRTYAKTWASWHPCPITMPTNLILALLTTLRKISRTGLLAHIAKHARACHAVRTGLRNLGFNMLVPDVFAAPTATAVVPRREFTAAEMITWLEQERGICITGGIGELAGKIFRVGHLGKATTDEYLAEFFAAVEAFLRFKGIEVGSDSLPDDMALVATVPAD